MDIYELTNETGSCIKAEKKNGKEAPIFDGVVSKILYPKDWKPESVTVTEPVAEVTEGRNQTVIIGCSVGVCVFILLVIIAIAAYSCCGKKRHEENANVNYIYVMPE